MTNRATVDDFPVGCTVRVARLPRHNRQASVQRVGQVGQVLWHYNNSRDPWIAIGEQLPGLGIRSHQMFRPWWLERGRVEWIKDEVTE